MYFDSKRVSDKRLDSMIKTGVWSEEAPVPAERLRSVFVSYIDFQGNLKKDGEIVVLDTVASDTVAVFQQLLDRQFPICSVRPIDEFEADDDKSCLANNTSAYCFRQILNSPLLSTHSYGIAIDLNPFQNPYVDPARNPGGKVEIEDYKLDYLQRANLRPGMVEPIVDIFQHRGFTVWGGAWITPLDYHHFQVPRTIAKIIVTLESEKATTFYDMYKVFRNQLSNLVWEEGREPDEFVSRLLSFKGSKEAFQHCIEEICFNNIPLKVIV